MPRREVGIATGLGLALAVGVSCLAPARRPSGGSLGGCQICHVDVVQKVARSRHKKGGVSCVTCHGPSKAHLEDENNEVKPDRVFAALEIDALCNDCHKELCAHAETRKPLPPDAKRRTCADCHGSHHVKLPPKK